MNRTQQILAAILILQILVVGGVFWATSPQDVAAGPLLPGYNAEHVSRITITDNTGNIVKMARQDEGWVLPDADDFPIDSEKATTLLENLAAISTSRPVTSTAASHERLQVAENDYAKKVEIEADNKLYFLFVGSSPRSNATHVRLLGQDKVFLTGDISGWDVQAQASSWIDVTLLSVPVDEITNLRLTNQHGQFELSMDGDNWIVDGVDAPGSEEQFNQTNLRALISQASNIRIVEPLGKTELSDYGLDNPSAIVAFTQNNDLSGEKAFEIQIGAKGDDNNYIVISSESDYYVKISGTFLDKFVNGSRGDFIGPVPTPTSVFQ
jgi:hypothetical protein